MASNNDSDFEIRPLEPVDRFNGFSLGDEKYLPLKIFLKKHATKFHQKCLAKTYVAVIDKRIIGYVTLVCGEIAREKNGLSDREDSYNYEHYPALKIARLGVDSSFQKRGVGEQLTYLALGIAKNEIAMRVGCRFVIVDSKKEAVAFYEKVGFTLIDTAENRARSEPILFLDILKVSN